MNRLNVLLVLAVMVGGTALTGCNDKTKEELNTLKVQYNDLQTEKADLQKSLTVSQNKNNELMTLLASKDSELDAARAELADMKGKKPESRGPIPEGWQETATGAKVTLASDILFAAGKATLSQQGEAKLRQIAATIKTTYPGSIVRVYGFTDSDPISKTKNLWTDNLDLSSNRAMAVVRLLQKLGINANNLEAIGMGETHPVTSNATREGKAANRRVEIAVVK